MSSRNTSILLVATLLAGCVTVPEGPNVAVMPGPGKSFQQFSAEDHSCRAYASESVGINVNEAGANNVIAGAAVGTALGAATGALLGGDRGTATGAGLGLILGTAQGATAAGVEQPGIQRRYDIAYEQCMYAKGNQLPPAPPTRYYRYRDYRQPVIIYQQPPTVIDRSYLPPPPPQ